MLRRFAGPSFREKAETYLSHGSIEVWLVFPKTRIVWICRDAGIRTERVASRSGLLPGVEIPFDQVF